MPCFRPTTPAIRTAPTHADGSTTCAWPPTPAAAPTVPPARWTRPVPRFRRQRVRHAARVRRAPPAWAHRRGLGSPHQPHRTRRARARRWDFARGGCASWPTPCLSGASRCYTSAGTPLLEIRRTALRSTSYPKISARDHRPARLRGDRAARRPRRRLRRGAAQRVHHALRLRGAAHRAAGLEARPVRALRLPRQTASCCRRAPRTRPCHRFPPSSTMSCAAPSRPPLGRDGPGTGGKPHPRPIPRCAPSYRAPPRRHSARGAAELPRRLLKRDAAACCGSRTPAPGHRRPHTPASSSAEGRRSCPRRRAGRGSR